MLQNKITDNCADEFISATVVMAIFNGEKHIKNQSVSIAESIPFDSGMVQIVLVDDCSIDSSLEIALGVFNKRPDFDVRVIKNKKNIGPFRSFEKGLKYVTGEIIFLADQDDYWCKSKFSVILKEFRNRPTLGLIAHSASLSKDGYLTGNLIPSLKNGELFALGCCLAFRSDLIQDMLERYRKLTSLLGYPLGHDRFICLYFQSSCNWTLLKQELIVHFIHSSNYSTRVKRKMSFREKFHKKIIERSAIYSVLRITSSQTIRLRINKLVYGVLAKIF